MRQRTNLDPKDAGTCIACLSKFVAFVILLLLVFTTAATAQDKTSFFKTVVVEEGSYKGEITCIGCNVVVRGDVGGETVTIWGDVTVYGRVREEIVAVGGRVQLKNGSEADDEIVAIGGQITTEGTALTPGKAGYTAFPWMHFPGQPSIGWRGALALVGFHLACVLLPTLFLRPRAVRSVAKASRRWFVTGLLGATAIIAFSYGLVALDDYLKASNLVEEILAVCFLAVLGIGIAGISLAIGDRFFPGLVLASLVTGTIVLVLLELIPYAGFLVMLLLVSWATGAALLSGLGFRGPRPPRVPKASTELKLIS